MVILTGPPGSGKTTVAGALAAKSAQPAVHLRTDDFWHAIKSGYVAPYLPESHAQNEVVVDVLAGAAFGYASGGFAVFVDGIVGPWFLEPFVAESARTGIALTYLVLRPDLATVLRRARERVSGDLKESAPIRALHAQFTALDGLESHVIDSTAQSLEETMAAVEAAISQSRFQLAAPPRSGQAR